MYCRNKNKECLKSWSPRIVEPLCCKAEVCNLFTWWLLIFRCTNDNLVVGASDFGQGDGLVVQVPPIGYDFVQQSMFVRGTIHDLIQVVLKAQLPGLETVEVAGKDDRGSGVRLEPKKLKGKFRVNLRLYYGRPQQLMEPSIDARLTRRVRKHYRI